MRPKITGKRMTALLLLPWVGLHLAAQFSRWSAQTAESSAFYSLPMERLSDGSSVTLDNVAQGQPLLLVFWTTWCEYCKEELATGSDLAAKLTAGPGPVNVLFVNVREHRAVVERAVGDAPLSDLVYLDLAGNVSGDLGIQGYPSYVLIDRSGSPIWKSEGITHDVAHEVASRISSGLVDE